MDDSKPGGLNIKMLFGLCWVVSLIIALIIGFAWGNGSKTASSTEVLTANTSEVPVTQTPSPQVVPSTSNNNLGSMNSTPTPILTPTPTTTNASTCSKTGYAQKWDYLTSYVIQEGDTVQDIAKEQLKDETRVNEILKINGVGLIVGATLYLPPPTITKSSGNLKQVYGKLMEKNKTSWHIGFSNDTKGQGILIPSFWFESIPNKDTYKIGDCIKVFFDEGFIVYSIALQ
jgi:hypothetical protein